MNLRPLGSSGLQVSEIGFGCWQLGGEGWGKASAREALAAVRRAIDLGINLFDTAPVYGFGRSEELLGKALRGAPGVLVVSKGGLVWDDRRNVAHDNRPASLREQLEASLRRLRRDAIDVYLLHWPDPAAPLAESAAALESLRAEGKVRAWGVSNFPALDVLRLDPRPQALQYPMNCLREHAAEHCAAAAAGEELLAMSAHRGWGFLAYDVLARGLLGGRYGEDASFGKRDLRRRDPRFEGAAFARNIARARKLAELARDLGAPPSAVALRAILHRPGVSACLAGMKTPAQVEENALASSLRLTDEARLRLGEL